MNVFPRAFDDAKRLRYSEAESQQASAKLWSIYIDEALRYDARLVESWKADMEGMLIFSGLFSASLTAFLIESYRTLQPDSGGLTVQLLSQISQQLAGTNSSSLGTPDFQPSASSLVCNTFWFISLSLSITCALLATLVEQWAREFLHRTEKRPSPVRRARIFSFLYFGVRRFGMHAVVDLIPMLLHISMMLFLAGLVAFLLPINRAMMGIIATILTGFLGVYAILTILPIISLDCPYRTPFSELLWNVIHRAKKRWAHSGHSKPSPSINDTMLAMALNHSETRDRRAFLWTMESLTDDHELLPFLEAIPEAIHGLKGFHLVNDYLFIPLLNPPTDGPSLGRRITDILLSCRNMVIAEPRRQRAFIAAMKAIWALGMISGRTGQMFIHNGQFWFDSKSQEVFHGLNKKLFLEGDYSHVLSCQQAATVAISYSRANNVRHAIDNILRKTETGTDTLATCLAGIQEILARVKDIGVLDLSESYQSLLQSLSEWHDSVSAHSNIVNLRKTLNSMQDELLWIEMNVSILGLFLLQAAGNVWERESLPHEFLQTCFRILPVVSTVPNVMRRPVLFSPPAPRCLDPSYYDHPAGKISDLDWIMRAFLRILPLVLPEEAGPIVVAYLGKRKDRNAEHFATEDCNLRHLYELLVSTLSPGIPGCDAIHALHAVFTLLIHYQFGHDLFSWTEFDQRLYNYMTENSIFASEAFRSLSAVVIQRKLKHLLVLVRDLDSRCFIETVIAVATHPCLSAGFPDVLSLSDSSNDQLVTQIRMKWVPQAAIFFLTEFLNTCAGPIEQPNMNATMQVISRCLPRSFVAVDTDVMSAFAGSSAVLVERLTQNPRNSDLKAMAARLCSLFDAAAYQPETAHLFGQVLSSFLAFLESQPDPNEFEIGRVRKTLNAWSVLKRDL